MSKKRSHIDLDPDYEDVSDRQNKRQRVLEEGGITQNILTPQLLTIVRNLTHCSLETRKRIIGKQCRPRSDAAECRV